VNILGKVTGALADDRGPDVTHAIAVPSEWLQAGTVLLVELPRLLACAACGGGGCDVCERRGAAQMRGRDEPPEVVRLELSEQVPVTGQIVRLPKHGAAGLVEGQPRGCLLLRICEGDLSKGVDREMPALPPPAQTLLGTRLLVAALVLVGIGLGLAMIFNH
jgi:hypothetical protein